MDSICEFCTALRSVVYCKSDAARLCLSCDAKVHSANALSNRHPRTLVCESCKRRPAYVRCFNHQLFMCRSCDSSHHVSTQHQKKVVSSYVGCPPAMDLAELWGFDLNRLENKSSFKDQYFFSSATADSEPEEGSSSQQTEVVKDDNQQDTCLILQQILDLRRLQLSEGSDRSGLVHDKGKADSLSYKYDAIPNMHTEHSLNQHYELPEESFLSNFTQLGHLTGSENPLQGDELWPGKSPAFNNELWPQNMQDIGFCDELQCLDDLHIPDVDLTFRNFEELFGGDQEQTRVLDDDENMACSFAEIHPSLGKADNRRGRTIEDTSAASADANKVFDSSDQVLNIQEKNKYLRPVQQSYSMSSLSASRITAESSSSEYKDDGLFPNVNAQKLLGDSSNPENGKLDGKENNLTRPKEKKKAWGYEMQVRSTTRKARSEGKRRGRGRFLLAEACESDTMSLARSF